VTGVTGDPGRYSRRVIEIWLNPACSKCRTAESELQAAGVEYTIRRYLDDPPTTAELEDVLARLGLQPWDVARTADAKRLGVTLPAKDADQRATWVRLLAEHPRLIQRPIITAADGTTVVGRDPESVARVIAAD
jgi:arsenate reductase (glutaredoxin)